MLFKKIISILLILIFSATSKADVKANISEIISDKVLELIPGDGHTEFSIDLRENYKPDFSILGVRQIKEKNNGNLFTQFSFSKTEQNNNERYVGNLGIGKRWLSDDKEIMNGLNSFIDYDHEGNMRASVGGELRGSVLEFTSNYYVSLGDANGEKVLDGYNLQLSSQVPHLHWAEIFYDTYKWNGEDRADIKGSKIGTELSLTPNISLEAAFDDKDRNGLEDEWYAKIIFVHPPKDGPTAMDGISSSIWKENKDMTEELLTKVKRQNKIMIEFKGTATISRSD